MRLVVLPSVVVDTFQDVVDCVVEEEYDCPVTDMLQEAVRTRDWSFDITKLKGNNALEQVGALVFGFYPCLKQFVPSEKKLRAFLRHSAFFYFDLPYHNPQHAADVLYSAHCMLRQVEDRVAPWQVYSYLMASIAHDISHTGFTNGYLKATNHELYQKYKHVPISTSEALHIDLGLKIMNHPEFGMLDKMDCSIQAAVQEFSTELIVGTDLSKQQETLAVNSHDILSLLKLLLHGADLGAAAKNLSIHKTWAARIIKEFYHEGDLLKELELPVASFLDRESSVSSTQLFFLSSLVQPIFQSIDKHLGLDVQEQLMNLETNIYYWSCLEINN